MATKTATPKNRAQSGLDDDLRTFVKSIARRLPAPPAKIARSPEDDPCVLIDTQVDGLRCMLVRQPERSGEAVSLSPREREIARMIAKGYPNKMIAGVLEISTWTVGTHLRRIFSKLHVSSRAAMVAALMHLGLLD